MKPDDGTQNIASLEKETQGSLRMNNDARLCNKGARHTRYLHETGDSQKREQVQVQVRRRHADLETTSKHLDDTEIGAGHLESTESTTKYLDNTNIEAGGAGLDDTLENEGAGLDGVVNGVGAWRQEQG